MKPTILSVLEQHARGRGLNVQAFTRGGTLLGSVAEAPQYCQPPAATPRGVAVCNRGCGAAIGDVEPGRPPRPAPCPFGALCAAVGVRGSEPGEEYVLVGGRTFEDCGRYAAFVDNAVAAGVSLGAMLTASVNVPFRTADDMVQKMSFLARAVEESLCAADEPQEGGGEPAAKAVHTVVDDCCEPTPFPRPGGNENRARSAERTLALRDFLRDMSGCREPALLFRAVVTGFSAFSGAQRVSLFVFDPKYRDLAMADAVGLPEKALKQGIRRPAFSGVMGKVFHNLSPVFVDHAEAGRLHPPAPHGHGSSYACLPLCARRRGLGVLNATDKADGTAFTGEDFLWMETLAGIVSMALERHLLEEALQEAGAPAGAPAEEDSAEYIDEEEVELHAASLGSHQPQVMEEVAASAFDREAS